LTCRHEKLLFLKFWTTNSNIYTLKIDLDTTKSYSEPMNSDIRSLKFAFEVSFIFVELLAIFSALNLLSAWKFDFQDYLHQFYDIVDLKKLERHFVRHFY